MKKINQLSKDAYNVIIARILETTITKDYITIMVE